MTGGSEGNDMIFGGPGNDTVTGGDGNEMIYGGDGDDHISGGSQGNDMIFGGPGNDTVTGGDGNTAIYGDGGNDDITGGQGNDMIFGGPGNDTLTGGDGNDMVYGGGGDDNITGGSQGNDMIFGGAGNDTVTGGDGNEMIYGDGGSDNISGGQGNDMIFGGSGNDTLTGGDGNDMVYGGGGDDDIGGSAGNDMIFGGTGNDTVTGGEGNEMIYGDGGNDNISGGQGNDMIFGGPGNDTLTGGDGNDMVYGGDGNDDIGGSAGNDMIFGGTGNDTVTGGEGNEMIYGDGGNDNISGGQGNDMIFGGTGNDTVTGGEGNDMVYGDGGDDHLTGTTGNDMIFGGPGNDTITGGDGNEMIYGGEGDDTVTGSIGNDMIFGGPGADTILIPIAVLESDQPVTIFGGDEHSADDDDDRLIALTNSDLTLTHSTVKIGSFGNVVFSDIQTARLIGDPGDNLIDASDFTGDAVLIGGAGNDTLIGGSGNDDLDGGDGDNQLVGNAGDDAYVFSAGDLGSQTVMESMSNGSDTLDFSLLATSISIDLDVGNPQTVTPGLTITLVDPQNFEGVIGTPGDDTILGNAADNSLVGLGGVDMLDGRGGADTLQAGGRRLVYLDFDSETDDDDHVYDNAERQAILQRMLIDYALFDVSIAILDAGAVLPTTPYITVVFNAGIMSVESDDVVVGGRSQRIGFRELAAGGRVLINANTFLRPTADVPATGTSEDNRLNGTSENFIALSSTIASHELAHMFGVRHHDAYGPIGSGVYALSTGGESLPNVNFATGADDTRLHLIASPNSVGTQMIDAFGDPYLGYREAIKLAFAENGMTRLESQTSKVNDPNFASPVQVIGELPTLAVPDTIGSLGSDLPSVSAINIAGRIVAPAVGETSESDFYSFSGVPGDLLTIEVLNETIRHRVDRVFDTVVRLYGPDGQVIEYQNSNPFGAFNDNSFESIDAILFDFRLPVRGDGSTDPQNYTIEVDTFSFDLPELNTVGLPSYLGNFDVANFVANNPNHPAVLDNDHGEYELLIYRFDGTTTATNVGDTLIGGAGADTIFGNTGNEQIYGFFSAAGDQFFDPSGASTFVPVAPELNPIELAYTANEGSLVTFSVSASDVDSNEVTWSLEGVDGQPLPAGATITSDGPFDATLRFTPPDDGQYNLRIVATDADGLRDSVDVTIEGENVAPVIDAIAITPIEVTENDPVTFSASVNDASSLDVLEATIDWGDGSSQTVAIVAGQISSTHVYSDSGTYEVTLSVVDDDGGFVDSSLILNVVDGGNMLEINGTSGNDYIYIAQFFGWYKVYTDFDGWSSYRIRDYDGLIVNAGSGNDYVQGSLLLFQPIVINGGAGKDTLIGGSANDTIFGGSGNDIIDGRFGDDQVNGGDGNDKIWGGHGDDFLRGDAGNDHIWGEWGNDIVLGGDGDDRLYGGSGRDLLIGGLGSDRLSGQSSDDILIGAFTTYDNDDQALESIMDEWTSSRSYAKRTGNLRDGMGTANGGNNQTVYLEAGVTVLDDQEDDRMTGGSGSDWFFALLNDDLEDTLIGKKSNEIVELLFADD
ncbi:PKD domain-containing protein [Rubripirellula amarantea]|nr:PKD domain-containing protein [Rubripirellula amarantea]